MLALPSLYVSAVLISSAFRDTYDEQGIDRSVLSRSIEESTTVITPLIPWHSSCIYYIGLFQLKTMAFVPFAVFCWMNLLVSLILTKSGILDRTFRKGNTRGLGPELQKKGSLKKEILKNVKICKSHE